MPALAIAKIQALTLAVLNDLATTQSKISAGTLGATLLLQDHNHVAGSLDERLNSVSVAFNAWCRVCDFGDDWYYWWNTLLAVYDDYLIYGVCKSGAWSYFKLDYSVGADSEVTITSTDQGQPVNVKLVCELMGVSEEAPVQSSADQDDYIEGMSQDQKDAFLKAKANKKGKGLPAKGKDTTVAKKDETQNYADPAGFKGESPSVQASAGAADDPVANTTPLTAEIVSAPVEHSDQNPKINVTTATEADEKPVTLPTESIRGDGNTPVEHSGDEGAGKGGDADDTDGGAVEKEMADTAAGLKNVDETTNYNKLNDEAIPAKQSPIIQSSSKGRDGTSYSTIMKLEQGENAAKKKVLKIQGIGTRADIINAEGVVYPLAVWEKNVQSMNELATAGKFLGKLEHPDQEQGLVDTAIKFNKFWLQGSDVWFDADVVPTDPYGKNLQALIEAGVQIDMSTRGYGRVETGTWRGQSVKLIQDDFVCVGIDAVYMGASTGSGITEAVFQSATPNKETPLTKVQQEAANLQIKVALEQGVRDLVASSKLTAVGQSAYTKALQAATTLEGLFETRDAMLPLLQTTFGVEQEAQVQSSTWAPQFITKQSVEETAPQTVGQLIDRLVQDLPDSFENQSVKIGQTECQSHFRSPRAACKRMLTNMAQEVKPGFNGPAAIMSLLALEQGKVAIAQNIMEQSLAAGATTAGANADPSGAPLSAPLIFPLVRRVFPHYIMNEVAAIQPMDRPEGKIFYLDAYRTQDPTTSNVDARIDLNTSSSPFNSSYADNATEGAAAQLIRLKLASITVSAYTKKLGANWSIEEMQDLRAYHGLDAAQELMGSVAREMALEWNKTVLDDMATQATAGSLTYGTVAPATGFPNQKDWDEYIWTYLQKLDNIIFSKRNGPMTHIVAGIDAALALAKSMRGTFSIGGENGGDMSEMYPGTTYFGVVNAPNGGRYKVFKTNFWGSGTTHGSTILGLRRGTEWSDTPYVWAPYTDYVTPILTDPSDFSQKQGIVSRAAKQVVVSDAMATLTVNTGGTGVVL